MDKVKAMWEAMGRTPPLSADERAAADAAAERAYLAGQEAAEDLEGVPDCIRRMYADEAEGAAMDARRRKRENALPAWMLDSPGLTLLRGRD